MQGHHFVMLILTLVVGYIIGIKFPAIGHKFGL